LSEPPKQQRAKHAERGEIDAGGAERHDKTQAFEAFVVAQGPEESEAGGGDEAAQEQGAIADVPFLPGAARIVAGFVKAVNHEDAVFMAGADEDRQAEEVGEVPTDVQ